MDLSTWPVVFASLSLVAISLGVARHFRLGVEREVATAAMRAAVQLLVVGALFTLIFESTSAMLWSWVWVIGMVVFATVVVVRRAAIDQRALVLVVGAAVAVSTLVTIGVVFGLSVLDLEPVELVVIVGITIGNAVPSAVLGVNQAKGVSTDGRGAIEAALSLGFDRRQIVRFMAPRAARSALIPQVERTRVVGLVALPGAMTGLLLAGVEPVDAVAVQLLVMYLVLGTAALCVVAVVLAVVASAVTPDLRVASWVLPADGERS